jgi:transcriptional regulator with XRE-family HTH domain
MNLKKPIQNGLKLRMLREAINLSQAELGQLISLSQAEYCKIENEEHSIQIDTLLKLSQIFKVDFTELLNTATGLTINNSQFHDSSFVAQNIFNNIKGYGGGIKIDIRRKP